MESEFGLPMSYIIWNTMEYTADYSGSSFGSFGLIRVKLRLFMVMFRGFKFGALEYTGIHS